MNISLYLEEEIVWVVKLHLNSALKEHAFSTAF